MKFVDDDDDDDDVLMFALLVANWPFCINKFDLIDKKLLNGYCENSY